MKKVILLFVSLAIIATLLFSLFGCTSPAPSPTPTPTKPASSPAPTAAPSPTAKPLNLPKSIVFGTNTTGTQSYTLGIALGDVITKYTGMKVDQYPQTYSAWVPMLNTGEAHMGYAASEGIYSAYLGKYDMEKPSDGKGFDIRTLMHGYDLYLAVFVPGNSNVKTIQDLKGKKIPTEYGAQTTTTLAALAALANGGLTDKDVIPQVSTNVTAGIRAVIEGRADAALCSVGASVITEMEAAKGARAIPLDNSKEAIARMKQIYPGYTTALVKAGYPGIKEDTNVLSKAMVVATSKNLSDDVAYAIVKASYEHIEEIYPVHAAFKEWTKGKFVSIDAVAPYHPGAIKYYKEIGIWTPEIEKLNNELIALKK